MIALREVDVLGIFVTPASVCLVAAIIACIPLRRLLNHLRVDRYVWNRALIDLCLLACIADLLILSLRYGGL